MAKVSLRIYNREIERLVEQGQTNEAIAHCRHILKTFPKHLETYRLLGKAYLESRRYAEAVDIFGRLLMAVPDDFVAHVGLSIIRDEENKLDDAIWHMERASEVQSSNPAIQAELQRLYGRRDGMEPPKVRMTRGALARIYVHGELYPQAIAEIRAVLASDPQRVDMQLLLAYSYYKSGQRADAADICNQLIKRYAYTFDANRILVDLLPASGGVESTQVYRLHVAEMDPYANFVKGSIFEMADVPDASVNLDRLEYTGEEVQMGQEWNNASLGFPSVPPLGAGTAVVEEQPEWLRSSAMEEPPQDSAPSASPPQPDESIPDFLRAAGWGASSGPEQPASIFDETPDEEGLVQADIPEWLKSQTPPSSAPVAAEPSLGIETPDYLTNLDPGFDPFAGAAKPAGDVPDWLKAEGESSDEVSPAQSAEPISDVPDWLKGVSDVPQPEPTPSTEESPDWLSSLGAMSAVTSEPQSEEPIIEPGNIPDWLKSSEPANEPSASVETLGSTMQEQDDAVAWLESLAAKHGAKPEELVTDPQKRSETPPEWVAQAQNIGAQPSEQIPPPGVETLGSTSQEQDDAVAWLESLAAKHGAKPEELVTDPNKRSDTPPEWVAQAQNIGSQPSAEPEPVKSEWSENAQNVGEEFFADFEKASAAESSASLPAEDETSLWLKNLEALKDEPMELSGSLSGVPDWMKADESQPEEKGTIPDWLGESESVGETPQRPLDTSSLPDWLGGLDKPEPSAIESEESLVKNQDLTDWLSGLDNEPGLDIDPETLRAPKPPLESRYPAREPVPTSSGLPSWMEAGEEPEEESWTPPSSPEPESVTLSAELPDWLKGVDEEESATDLAGGELPPWSHREQWEAEGGALTPPKPTSPSDWHPISTSQEAEPVGAPRTGQKLVQNPPSPEPSEPAGKRKSFQKQGLPRGRKSEGQASVSTLNLAKAELDRGDIPEALMHFGKLIKKGKHLEEVIGNLSESLYRYPVEVGIWQTLGDAYMRANRLKEALDAYNKAEELIR